MPLCGGSKTVQRKLVLLYACMRVTWLVVDMTGWVTDRWMVGDCRGDGACGKTSLLNVFTRG